MPAFLENIALDLKKRFENETGDICIVLPNRRAGLFIRKYLSKQFQKTIWAPDTFSVEDFVVKLSGKTLADPLTQLFELYNVHLEKQADQAQDFDNFSNWAQVLLSDFNEIDLYLADPRQVFSYLNEAKALQFWNVGEKPLTDFEKNYLAFYQSLYNYYEGLKKRLTEKGLVYQGLAYRQVAENLAEISKDLPWKKIMFAGLNALSTSEERIIQFLLEKGVAEISWDADRYYVDDPAQEAGDFIRQYIPRWSGEKVRYLEEHFRGEKNIAVTGVARNTGQARLAGQLISELKEKEVKLEDTAVVLADEKLLLPLLNALPPNTGEVNITMGFPVSLTPLYRLVKSVFQLQENAEKLRPASEGKEAIFYAQDLIAILMHPYINLALKADENNNSSGIVKVINRIRNSNKVFYSLEEIMGLMPTAGEAGNAIALLIFNRWKSPSEAIERLLELTGLLRSSVLPEKPEKMDSQSRIEMEYLFHFNKTFMRARSLMAGTTAVGSLRSLRRVLFQILDKATIPFFGEPLKGLQIMGVLETRALDFKNIILLSANEGILPSGRSANTFIPYDVKKNFKLPTHNEKDAVFAYHFYRLLQRAENIHLLYDTEGDSLGGGEKSRFITQLLHELPIYNPSIKINEDILQIPALSGLEQDDIKVEKSDDVMKRLAEKAIKGFSPTALNTYLNCSLQFYFKEIAGLSEAEEIEETIEANTLGTVIHDVLKKLYEPFRNMTLIRDDIKWMKEKYRDLLAVSFTENYRDGDLEHGKNYLIYRVAALLILNFLNSEEKIIQNPTHQLEILDLEKFSDAQFEISNSEVPRVRIKGTIDRIDRLDGQLRIIDYKTGMVYPGELNLKQWEDLQEGPKHGKALQLLFYALLYDQQKNPGENIETGNISLRNFSKGFQNVNIPDKAPIDRLALQSFGEQVRLILEDIFNKESPFEQTDDEKNCRYCPYKTICNIN